MVCQLIDDVLDMKNYDNAKFILTPQQQFGTWARISLPSLLSPVSKVFLCSPV